MTSSSAAFPVPASVVVPSGEKAFSLNVQTSAVSASAIATITAKYNGGTETASATITPVVLPLLSSVTVSPISVTAGASATLVVILSAAAPPTGATVTLTSSSAAFPVPASVVVPPGSKTASLIVQTALVTASTSATIAAKYNGGTETASVSITPPATSVSLSAVTIGVTSGTMYLSSFPRGRALRASICNHSQSP